MATQEQIAGRAQRLESFGKGHQQLVEALKQFPRAMWKYRAQPDGWSIHEIIIHISDGETLGYGRCRKAIAEPGASVMLYDQPAWGSKLRYIDQNPDDALELFKWLRHASYDLVRMLPPDIWSSTFTHPERGLLTLDDWLIIYEGHITGHINQMREVFAAWQAAGSPA